jgi:hypothetical protein
MSEGGVGRLLVASLHQGIADLLPGRLEFYEAWLSPAGLRNGRIGLAPLAAVLSFLRQEGPPYHLVAERAGEYSAEWTMAALPAVLRLAIRVAPPGLRLRLAMRVLKGMIRRTYGGTRAIVHRRSGGRAVDLRGSLFCELRGHVDQPMCGFYASAARRLLQLCRLEGEVGTDACRAVGAERCVMVVRVRRRGRNGG